MKKTNVSTNAPATDTLQAAVLAAQYQRDEQEREILSQIDVVHYYSERWHGCFGFGYQAGKLVEFNIPAVRIGRIGLENNSIREIGLGESLEWAIHLHFADKRFDSCRQEGPGYPRWLQALHAAMK